MLLKPATRRHGYRSGLGGASSDGQYWTDGSRIESIPDPDSMGRWLSGRKHPPAKRVGGVKLPRGFESLPSRQSRILGSQLPRISSVAESPLIKSSMKVDQNRSTIIAGGSIALSSSAIWSAITSLSSNSAPLP